MPTMSRVEGLRFEQARLKNQLRYLFDQLEANNEMINNHNASIRARNALVSEPNAAPVATSRTARSSSRFSIENFGA